MKIGIIHTSYTQKGGEDSVVEHEHKLLLNNGIEVSLLNFKNPTGSVSQIFNFLISVFNIGSYYKTRDWIKKEKPQVIHIHNWHFKVSPSVFYCAKKYKIPVVLTLHNYRLLCPSATLFYNGELFLESLKGGFPWKAVKNKLYRNSLVQTFWLAFIIRLHRTIGTWRKVNLYIALTSFARELYLNSDLNIPDKNIVVKGNSVEDKGSQTDSRNNGFLFVGRLTSEKGIEVLLSALSGSELHLEIIGDGPLQALVKEKAEREKNISYTGALPNSEIIRKMKSCSALIFPSVWFEGMPMTIIESFSCGTPVIASDLGAMKGMITDGYNGLLFSPNNHTDLQRKITDWNNMQLSEKEIFYKNARNSYEQQYSPGSNFNKLMEIYISLIK